MTKAEAEKLYGVPVYTRPDFVPTHLFTRYTLEKKMKVIIADNVSPDAVLTATANKYNNNGVILLYDVNKFSKQFAHPFDQIMQNFIL